MNNIEDLRDALIADVILGIEAMSHEDLVRELVHIKTSPLESMTSKQLFLFRRKQVEDSLKKYGCED